MSYGKSHRRSDKRDDKKMEKIRERPGLSNAGEYKGLVTAGPHGSYPLGYKPGGISPKRVRAALALGHHLGSRGEEKLRSNIGHILKRKGKMLGLANRLIHGGK